ncbi:type VI secretion system contractile sheath small subunit [Inquilinus sp. CA228]|uniref:type VI secretion system contractile sheath small subunit n=1 Tax=Inquilinus sp. CA228 TaxID=3455609 RepID=UPI003F8D15A4
MSNDGSVAPKDRVNIRYIPAGGDQKEEVELPLKLLVIGEFATRADDSPIGERELISIDKDTFNDVMRGQNLSLDLKVPNRLSDADASEEKEDLAFNLTLSTLKDFDPDGVAAQVPELRKLLELREALLALKGPLGNVASFRKALQSLLGDEQARARLQEELLRIPGPDA